MDMTETMTKETGMMNFTSLKNAANYALRANYPMFVFDGPDGGYVVATAKQSKELRGFGLEPLSISETAKAAA